MRAPITLFWFRQDLRLSDNPGLTEALKQGPVMLLYILEKEESKESKMGGASRWWLHHSLEKLDASVDHQLNFYSGKAHEVITQLLKQYEVKAVYWNRCYEPWRSTRDAALKDLLKKSNIECKSFNSSLLWEPWEILKKDKTPYQVFTPFYRQALLQTGTIRKPLPKPPALALVKDSQNKTTLQDLNLQPKIAWDTIIKEKWNCGEEAAQKKWSLFLQHDLLGYKESRDYLEAPHVSNLSPHLHFGEISPHQLWHSASEEGVLRAKEDAHHFLRQLAWREFSYALLFHFPTLPQENFQPKFNRFPWQENTTLLKAWQQGKTGYPIVDAGMRELWQTGTMHNRVRMITASFLVKNLLIHWHQGAAWFWDCLLDADLANNSASWQWVAGSGVDAAPYFRIFNPVLQGEKFDSEGIYLRRFVPELARLPKKFLFKPWDAPTCVLEAAGVTLGKNYPKPIVALSSSRDAALEAYHSL